MMRRIFLTLLAAAAFVACSRSHHESRPGAVAKPKEAEPIGRNPNVFAADGMCSDKLTRHFERHKQLLHGILGTLHGRMKDYKQARAASVGHSWYAGVTNSERRAADALIQTFAFWRDIYKPFHQRYGDFWCVRRDDMMVLSSSDLEKEIDEIYETVKHLGPLPPAQPFVIGD